MTDIVERLRSHGVIPESLGGEAADEIERLREEVKWRKNALELITIRRPATADKEQG